MKNYTHKRAILGLFFVSGACGLVYEITWTRQLTLIFGISTFAVSAVLCSFMAGLALGSYVFGRVADRSSNPLRLYAVLELGIGLFALFLPLMLKEMEPVFVFFYRIFIEQMYLFSPIRFALSFFILLIPATLMGGTLPVMSRYVIRTSSRIGWNVSLLYGLNTLGAVAGSFAVGFILLGSLGILKTTYLTVAANTVVAILAYVFSRAPQPRGEMTGEMKEADGRCAVLPILRTITLLAIGLSGVASLGYEVLWTRVMLLYLNNSTYAFTTMLVTLLIGIAVGSLCLTRFIDRIKMPVFLFGLIEFAMGFYIVLSILMMRRLPGLAKKLAVLLTIDAWWKSVVIFFSQAGVIIFIPAFLMGMTVPLAVRICTNNLTRLGNRVGEVYSLNTAGAILGSFITGFILIPVIGVRNSFFVLICLNFLIGGLLISCASNYPHIRIKRAVFSVLFLALLAGSSHLLLPSDIFYQYYKKVLHRIFFYKEEIDDTVMVAELNEDPLSRMTVFSDMRGTAGLWTAKGNRMLGHLPLLLHKNPRSALCICFGVGNSLHAIGCHPLEKIDCVELSPGVIDAAPYFSATNKNILSDPRVRLFIEDGRNYLLGRSDTYDVILLEPPHLHTAGVVNLYTKEFYELCRKRLNEGGIFLQWLQVDLHSEEETKMLINTLYQVFPHSVIWENCGRGGDWLLLGSTKRITIDFPLFKQRFYSERVYQDLKEVGLGDPYDVLTYFLFDENVGQEFVRGAGMVTDDKTYIDFSVPRQFFTSYGIFGIFGQNIQTYSRKGEWGKGWSLVYIYPFVKYRQNVAALIDNKGTDQTEKNKVLAALSEHTEQKKKFKYLEQLAAEHPDLLEQLRQSEQQYLRNKGLL